MHAEKVFVRKMKCPVYDAMEWTGLGLYICNFVWKASHACKLLHIFTRFRWTVCSHAVWVATVGNKLRQQLHLILLAILGQWMNSR